MSQTKTVLVVEDEPDLRAVYELILKSRGFDVHTAVNGSDGLDQVRKHKPRLVMLDIFMPVMDGRDFMKNLDASKYPDLKIIVCSNNSDDALQAEMTGLGADQVILKADLAPSDLLNVVEPYFKDLA